MECTFLLGVGLVTTLFGDIVCVKVKARDIDGVIRRVERNGIVYNGAGLAPSGLAANHTGAIIPFYADLACVGRHIKVFSHGVLDNGLAVEAYIALAELAADLLENCAEGIRVGSRQIVAVVTLKAGVQ